MKDNEIMKKLFLEGLSDYEKEHYDELFNQGGHNRILVYDGTMEEFDKEFGLVNFEDIRQYSYNKFHKNETNK